MHAKLNLPRINHHKNQSPYIPHRSQPRSVHPSKTYIMQNEGSFDRNDAGVGTGVARAQDDVMTVQIKVNAQTGKIIDAKFRTFGCQSAIASSTLITEWVKGKQLHHALDLKSTQIAEHLSLPPAKLYCGQLAEDAVKAAVKDYLAKHS